MSEHIIFTVIVLIVGFAALAYWLKTRGDQRVIAGAGKGVVPLETPSGCTIVDGSYLVAPQEEDEDPINYMKRLLAFAASQHIDDRKVVIRDLLLEKGHAPAHFDLDRTGDCTLRNPFSVLLAIEVEREYGRRDLIAKRRKDGFTIHDGQDFTDKAIFEHLAKKAARYEIANTEHIDPREVTDEQVNALIANKVKTAGVSIVELTHMSIVADGKGTSNLADAIDAMSADAFGPTAEEPEEDSDDECFDPYAEVQPLNESLVTGIGDGTFESVEDYLRYKHPDDYDEDGNPLNPAEATSDIEEPVDDDKHPDELDPDDDIPVSGWTMALQESPAGNVIIDLKAHEKAAERGVPEGSATVIVPEGDGSGNNLAASLDAMSANAFSSPSTE